MTGINNLERVRKLLRLLSSPQEAEVAAAVRALMRTLEADGADMHALADAVGNGKLSEADMRVLYDSGFQDGKRTAEGSGRPRSAASTNLAGTRSQASAPHADGFAASASGNSSTIWSAERFTAAPRPRSKPNGCATSTQG
jgi:hypothetical protein